MKAWKVGGRDLSLHAGSITEVQADAVITAANAALAGGGGVDGAVHRAAGPALLAACRALPADARGIRCPPGQARVTPGYRLAPWVIHAVGPIWEPGRTVRCAQELAMAWDTALFLAEIKECVQVVAPAISTGAYGYPLDEAASIAVTRTLAFLRRGPAVQAVTFALPVEEVYQAFERAIVSDLG